MRNPVTEARSKPRLTHEPLREDTERLYLFKSKHLVETFILVCSFMTNLSHDLRVTAWKHKG